MLKFRQALTEDAPSPPPPEGALKMGFIGKPNIRTKDLLQKGINKRNGGGVGELTKLQKSIRTHFEK